MGGPIYRSQIRFFFPLPVTISTKLEDACKGKIFKIHSANLCCIDTVVQLVYSRRHPMLMHEFTSALYVPIYSRAITKSRNRDPLWQLGENVRETKDDHESNLVM
jgi:hypothetical protein